jgi:LAO/AO transport system kinase
MSLAEKVLDGDVTAAARLITLLENNELEVLAEIDTLYARTGQAYIIGITGAPGTGKSTLTDNLIDHFRSRGRNIGVVAVDPTSALTGGAILGDRVWMQRHGTDDKVFIRSLASRGWSGGLARVVLGAVHVMDALGKEIILIETVGSGQIEMDIFRAADTTLVVLNPGSGDDIQMMKAGILEVVDIFVVNKADREGTDLLKASIESMLSLSAGRGNRWQPPVVLTEAINDQGTAELAEAINKHRDYLTDDSGLQERRRERARLDILENLEGVFRDFISSASGSELLSKSVDDLLQGKAVPRLAAAKLAGLFNDFIKEWER